MDLQVVEVPGKGRILLGELTSADMVQLYLKPLTGSLKLDYVQVGRQAGWQASRGIHVFLLSVSASTLLVKLPCNEFDNTARL